jgi:hypothetical protein
MQNSMKNKSILSVSAVIISMLFIAGLFGVSVHSASADVIGDSYDGGCCDTSYTPSYDYSYSSGTPGYGGNITLPPPPRYDACPNIGGTQSNVPAGYQKNSAGNCVKIPVKPTCTLYATPANITLGEHSVLSWVSHNATAGSINQGIGAVGPNNTAGTRNVSPQQTTAYTMTVSGPGGSATCARTIVVRTPTPTPVCPAGTTGTYPNCVVPTPVCPSGTTGNYPNCAVTQVSCPQGMIAAGNNICINNVNTNQNNNQNVNNVVVNVPTYQPVVSQPIYNAPSCSLTASQTYIAYGQPVTIYWNSNNANSGTINNGIGNVTVNGSRTMYPAYTTTYTGTFYGYNGQQENCSVTVQVSSGVTYNNPPVNNTPYVTLSEVPYTGLELGTTGTILYWGFLVLWCLFAAYLVVIKRTHLSIYRWYSEMLFGTPSFAGNGMTSTAQATYSTPVTTYSAPVVRPAATTNDAIDPFIMQQINRGR